MSYQLLFFTLFWSAKLIANPLSDLPNPFNYDLHVEVLPGKSQNKEVLICMHGMGSDYTIGQVVKSNSFVPFSIVSFNFPDYGRYDSHNWMRTSFGTINEILPALYVWKNYTDEGYNVHLYGFSAGGGVIINALAVLNNNWYDDELAKIGITLDQKQKMLETVQKGSVILEVPLKSFDEIADLGEKRIRLLATRARKHKMCPIENLSYLKNLSLNCFVYFSNPDDALGNRDDQEFIQKLRQANQKGTTFAIIGNSEGHTAYHPELWSAYNAFLENRQ